MNTEEWTGFIWLSSWTNDGI